MGKKRKGRPLGRPEEPTTTSGKMARITTWKDVADSEDEFHMNRDKILLDSVKAGHKSDRDMEDEAFLEQSDQEILAGSSDEDEEDGVEGEDFEDAHSNISNDSATAPTAARGSKSTEKDVEDDDEDWGTSKRDYYNTDDIVTHEDAKAEVEEAIRLEKKKLARLKAADYGLDEVEWIGKGQDESQAGTADASSRRVLKETLQPWIPTPEMTANDHRRILDSWYPEFEHLVKEMESLAPVLDDLETQISLNPSYDAERPVTVAQLRYRALAAYLSAIAMYFALLASSSTGEGRPMDPEELHSHEVMTCLVDTRQTWQRVEDMKEAPSEASLAVQEPSLKHALEERMADDRPVKLARTAKPQDTKGSKRAQRAAAAQAEMSERRAKQQLEMEESLAGLDDLLPHRQTLGTTNVKDTTDMDIDSNSDFGEETHLSARSAAEKDKRRKSLRFYTSQIVQKSNKRHDAGRDAGGDADVPYRERLKDRQARLNAEAEKRGRKLDEYGRGRGDGPGSELHGGESDVHDDDEPTADHNRDRGADDDYYDMIAQRTSAKRAAQTFAAASTTHPSSTSTSHDAGASTTTGKRAIGYVIEKNKGLAPRRKKEVRNPRVKKRLRYEDKKKKLASMKPVFKAGGEGRGGYGGERTGIKTGLVKSVKL